MRRRPKNIEIDAMSDAAAQNSKMVGRAVSTVTSTSLGIVAGVVLDMIVVATFGMKSQTDAYYIAVTAPLVIITLMGLQATRVVQPLFITKWETAGKTASWDYLNLIVTSGTTIVAALCGVAALLSPVIVRFQTVGLSGDAVFLTVRLSVCLFLILPLSFPLVVMSAALQSLGIFALPAAMKFFESFFKILLLLLLGQVVGIEAMVWGTLAGTIFHVMLSYLTLRRRGYRFRPIWDFSRPEMVQAYRLMIFPLAGQACAVGVESMTNALGTLLGPGSVTAVRLGTRIIDSFAGLLAGSVVTAAIPTVVSSIANRDWAATRGNLQYGLYMLLLVTIPFSVWLAFTNHALIALLYQRGSFSTADTAVVANILLLLIPSVLAGRLRSLLELPFFAAQDTRTPLVGALVGALSFVGFSYALVRSVGIYGIPLGRSIAYVIAAWFMEFLVRRRFGAVGFATLRNRFGKICGASFVMAAFIYLGNILTAGLPLRGVSGALVSLGVPSAIGFAALSGAFLKLGLVSPSLLRIGHPAVRRYMASLSVSAESDNAL
jgi:putative peptidoglycan lipid II flippase